MNCLNVDSLTARWGIFVKQLSPPCVRWLNAHVRDRRRATLIYRGDISKYYIDMKIMGVEEIWKYGRWSLKCIRDEDGEILSLSVKYKGREAGRHSLYVLTADRRGQIRGGTNRGNQPIVLANYGIPSVWTDTQTRRRRRPWKLRFALVRKATPLGIFHLRASPYIIINKGETLHCLSASCTLKEWMSNHLATQCFKQRSRPHVITNIRPSMPRWKPHQQKWKSSKQSLVNVLHFCTIQAIHAFLRGVE